MLRTSSARSASGIMTEFAQEMVLGGICAGHGGKEVFADVCNLLYVRLSPSPAAVPKEK
jgi:hypothetical protein